MNEHACRYIQKLKTGLTYISSCSLVASGSGQSALVPQNNLSGLPEEHRNTTESLLYSVLLYHYRSIPAHLVHFPRHQYVNINIYKKTIMFVWFFFNLQPFFQPDFFRLSSYINVNQG